MLLRQVNVQKMTELKAILDRSRHTVRYIDNPYMHRCQSCP